MLATQKLGLHHWTRHPRRLRLIAVSTAAFFLATGVAGAAWVATGTGNGYSKAYSMPTGNTPTVSVSGVDVTVSWTGNTIGGAAVDSYTIKRYNTSNVLQSIGSACSGSITGTSCTETSVAAGRWKYTVTPKKGNNWVGTEGSYSSQAHVVGAPTTLTCTNCSTYGSTKYIYSTNVSSVSVQVDLPSTSETGDTVHLTLTDGTNTVTPATKAGTTGSGSVTFTSINASSLNQGAVSINAWVTEGGSTSATTTLAVTKDTVAPTASNISAPNSGANVGKMDAGEVITFTFSEAMDPGSILASWSGSSTNVTVSWTNSPDNFTMGVNLGTVASNADLVSNTLTWSNSPMVLSGATLTITLGTVSNASRLKTDNVAQNMTWTPSASAKDLAGNAISTTAKTETDNDVDF